jgi:hypothetical protein
MIPFLEKKTVRCIHNFFSDFFPVFMNNAWHVGYIRIARWIKNHGFRENTLGNIKLPMVSFIPLGNTPSTTNSGFEPVRSIMHDDAFVISFKKQENTEDAGTVPEIPSIRCTYRVSHSGSMCPACFSS